MNLRRTFFLFGALCAAAVPWIANAQEAAAVVRMVVPFAAGNALDSAARALADSLHKTTGRQVIVDNRPGAGGLIGTAEVARAKPDGSVLLFTTGGHTTNAVLYTKLPYDSLRDFTPITQIDKSPGFVLLVRADSPYNSVAQLIQAAKGKPGTISYGSWGTGNTTHLIGELFTRAAGIELLHVPYKGSPLTDFLGGHVELTFLGSSLAQPLLQEGKVRALAISSDQRAPGLPEVPTFVELGIKDVNIPAWSGLFAPRGMPPAAAAALQREVAAAVQRPEYLTNMKILATTPVASTPDQFAAYVGAEIERYKKQLQPLGIRLD